MQGSHHRCTTSAPRGSASGFLLSERYHLGVVLGHAKTIRQWESQFVNYFDSRATNAKSEAPNLTIKQVKRSGFGFRRFDNYRLRVLYRCG